MAAFEMDMSEISRKKIGILGGTFNPIHIGHLLLAQYALEEACLNQVLFMPSGQSYMKKNLYILPAEHRMKLASLSIQDNPRFQLSDLEIVRGGYTYTYETLEELTQANPENRYYFIIGADCLFSITKWKEPERIFRSCTILAAVRDDRDLGQLQTQAELLRKQYQAEILLLNFPRIDISSSEIRNRIINGQSIRYMVAPAAADYIAEHKLFL